MAKYGKLGATHVQLEPTYIQEVLRTVTLALAPYVPFSQRYTMELKSHTGGSVEDGFFRITPVEEERNKEWQANVDRYLTRNNTTQGKMAQESPNLDSQLNPLALQLSRLLDELGQGSPHVKKYQETELGELTTRFGAELLREVQEKAGIEMPSAHITGEQEALLTKSIDGMSKMGIDFARDDSTEPIFQAIKKAFGKEMVKNSVAMEITDSKFKKEISKGQKEGQSAEEAWDIMQKEIKTKYGKINETFKEIYKSLKLADKDINFKIILQTIRDSDKKIAKGLIGVGAGHIYPLMVQFTDRIFRMTEINSLFHSPDQPAYNYQLPLGGTGYMVMLKLAADWSKGYPQMVVLQKGIANTGGGGTLTDLFIAYEKKLIGANAIFTETAIERVYIAAANDYYMTKWKAEHLDTMMAATVDHALSVDASVDFARMDKTGGSKEAGPTGAMAVKGTDVAAMLGKQFDEIRKPGGKPTEVFVKAWKKIFAEANKATELWKQKVVGKSNNPNTGHNFDENKPYSWADQGIWSDNTQKTWTPEKDPIGGINVSMAPLVISQAGQSVARFALKSTALTKASKSTPAGGARYDDPSRGITKGDKVRRGRFLRYKEEGWVGKETTEKIAQWKF